MLSQRCSNREERAARRCRIVWLLKARLARSSRQAMTCDRVTSLNLPGWLMPMNPTKSCSAFSYARRVLLLLMLANHSSSGGTSARPWKRAAVSSRWEEGAGGDASSWTARTITEAHLAQPIRGALSQKPRGVPCGKRHAHRIRRDVPRVQIFAPAIIRQSGISRPPAEEGGSVLVHPM